MNDWGGVRPTLAVATLIFLIGCGGAGGRPPGITGAPAVTLSAANLDFGAQRVGTSGSLTLTITDAGPGFAPEMLTEFGKPYQSSSYRL